ncbi:hypothetical protein [Ancylobacter sp. SL191]|uniref:hypothetical protein n=1 Tax=Ancylobacter sp. SL191 TaxID=2995166 RepID=UPI00226F58E7|nr:hypothetical protein [Ancylobacter sp. SL191]WAC28208.1 hypothetical protein OU996_03850 [Ancylobacter sp. SL191]
MMRAHGQHRQQRAPRGAARDQVKASVRRAALPLCAAFAFLPLMPNEGARAGEPLPRPQVDYRLVAKGPQDARMTIAHSGERMRLEVTQADMPGDMTGIVDLARNRMLMLVAIPGMGNRAFDVELPADFAAFDPGGEGTRGGTEKVAGETCHVWRTREDRSGTPVEACITEDGIALRAKAEVSGKPRVLFEATEVVREPLGAALFELPAGVKVTRLPSGMQGMMPGLPGLPGLLR